MLKLISAFIIGYFVATCVAGTMIVLGDNAALRQLSVIQRIAICQELAHPTPTHPRYPDQLKILRDSIRPLLTIPYRTNRLLRQKEA